MDFGYILDFVYEFAYFLGVLGLFLVFAIFKGRQATINVIVGLYLALLISLEFPAYEQLFGTLNEGSSMAFAKLGFFGVITLLTTALTWRIMPDEFREERFESFWKKFALALGATILVISFSFHVLPISEFLNPDTPLQALFAPEQFFFWWLLAPLIIVYLT